MKINWLKTLISKLRRKGKSYYIKSIRLSRAIKKDPWIILTAPIELLKKTLTFKNFKKTLLFSIKYLFLAAVGIAGTLGLLLGIATYFIDDEDVNRNISKWVRDSTGGDLRAEETHLSILTGITLKNLKLYPQDLNKYPNQEPLVTIDQINLHYDILRIFLAEVNLKSFQIIHPTIYLKQIDDTWNYQPILDFLEKNKSEPEKEEQPLEEEEDQEVLISDLLPIHPASILIMPVKLNIEAIGFENLALQLTQIERNPKDEKVITKTEFKGLSTKAALNWFGTNSTMEFFLGQTEDEPMTLTQTKTSQGESSESLHLSFNMEQKIELEDLSIIKIETKGLLKNYEKDQVSLADVPVNIDIEVELLDSLDGIRVKEGKIGFFDVLEMELAGTIQSIEKHLDKFNIGISQSFSINLDKAEALISQLGLPYQVGGQILLEPLEIKGPLHTSEISSELKKGTVPNLDLKLNLKDVFFRIKDSGLALAKTNGHILVNLDSPVGGDGIESNLDLKIDTHGLSLQQKMGDKMATISVSKTTLQAAATAGYPEIVIPFLRLNLDVQAIKAKIGAESPITIPLTFETYGSLSKNFDKISLDTSLDIEDLVDLSFALRCRQTCQKFKLRNILQFDDFSKIYTFIQPILAKSMDLNQVPESLSGKLSFTTQMRGSTKDIKETNLEKILAQTSGKISTQLNLEKFSTQIPLKNLVVNDLNTKLAIAGTFKKQVVDFRQSFAEIGLDLSEEDSNQRLRLKHFNTTTTVTNEAKPSTDFKALAKTLFTDIHTNLFLGELELKGILPHPVNGLNLSLKANQDQLAKIELKEVLLKAPDFGAKFSLSGNTYLDPTFLPTSFKVQTNIDIESAGGSGLASGITTSGKMSLGSSVASEDLRVFEINGFSSFKEFHLKVPKPGQESEKLLEVENMNGSIPLQQKVDLTPFINIPALLASKESIEKDKEKKDSVLNEETNASSEEDEEDASANEEQSVEGKSQESETQPESPQIDQIDSLFTTKEKTLLDKTNLVGHVDFPTVKPFYPKLKTLTIERISGFHLDFTDIELDMEVKQNWFAINQFQIGFLDGKIQGDLRLSFTPLPEAIKLAIHVTRLNTQKLLDQFPHLKGKAGSWDVFSDPNLDANVHLAFDMINNDMSGGIDITTIGKEQLKMLLYYLDPDLTNPSLNPIRTALNFGDVVKVSVPIKNGFIGLDVGVTVLAVPIPLPKLQQFPIGQLISNLQTGSSSSEAQNDQKL